MGYEAYCMAQNFSRDRYHYICEGLSILIIKWILVVTAFHRQLPSLSRHPSRQYRQNLSWQQGHQRSPQLHQLSIKVKPTAPTIKQSQAFPSLIRKWNNIDPFKNKSIYRMDVSFKLTMKQQIDIDQVVITPDKSEITNLDETVQK